MEMNEEEQVLFFGKELEELLFKIRGEVSEGRRLRGRNYGAPVPGRSQEEGAAGPVPGERRQEEKNKVVA